VDVLEIAFALQEELVDRESIAIVQFPFFSVITQECMTSNSCFFLSLRFHGCTLSCHRENVECSDILSLLQRAKAAEFMHIAYQLSCAADVEGRAGSTAGRQRLQAASEAALALRRERAGVHKARRAHEASQRIKRIAAKLIKRLSPHMPPGQQHSSGDMARASNEVETQSVREPASGQADVSATSIAGSVRQLGDEYGIQPGENA
jgi:hypothetical protein